MNATAKLSNLLEPLELTPNDDYHVCYDRQTGEIVMVERRILSAIEEGEEESLADLPDWQKPDIEVARAIVEDKSDRFIDPPDKVEFNEYQHMEQFIDTIGDRRIAEQLDRAIHGSGAFRRFKDELNRLCLEQEWYRYRDNAMREFAIEWAKDNDVPYIDDLKGRKYQR